VTNVPASYTRLKEKQRSTRAAFSEALALRTHRALSWLGRAEQESSDVDARFVLLWISFNSAYACKIDASSSSERGAFNLYFQTLVDLDKRRRIYDAVWSRFPKEIDQLLANKYVFAPFWHHHNGVEGYQDWNERLLSSNRVSVRALKALDTAKTLSIVFDRLYVLRNQLVHGGATWNSSTNRAQVRDGAAVLGWLMPLFIDVMMDNPNRDWGRPFYPVVS